MLGKSFLGQPGEDILRARKAVLPALFVGEFGQPEARQQLPLECERKGDGRWWAEVPQLPGVLAYGTSADEAVANAEVLALRVLADRLERGESRPLDIRISVPAAA